MKTAGPDFSSGSAPPQVSAPAHWRVIDFISDLHLQAGAPETFQAWQHYMASTQADAVFILGDLFEVWVGDDAATQELTREPSFEVRCQHILAATSKRLELFFMHGNRDFLLGKAFAKACGMTLLQDPTVLAFNDKRWLLSHGDALCLDDTDYQQFRGEVRSAAWRNGFLAKPLPERQAIARGLRAQSESRKASAVGYADVDQGTALQWLATAQADTLIHGHTHQPADHLMNPKRDATLAVTALAGESRQRLVLSDWDACASPPRLEVLRLRAGQSPERVKLASGF